MSTVRFDLPIPDDFTKTWWDATAEGRLLIIRCASCHEAHYYPRPFCPRCGSSDVSWEEASGEAVLYTWSVVHRNDLPPFNERVPYVAAIVDLAEGPRMMTNVVDCDFDSLKVGMRLRVKFREMADGYFVPVFTPE
ncbi:MAG TPA: Zn-ribbon domain-containing OB-fold protein [Acidimicrobiales bacterium]|nr:Zn-ribbon domain-containing OB-fold protein [Acidimicrobiales bacterium]